ncbi:MAG: DUF2079 domain-containing protein [Chloroflexales bacterium]|nr:DUF2079 domain-containing protein [Chloroflexales bacterium]
MTIPTWLTPRRALAALMTLVSLALIGAGSYKYSYWGHGFDMVDFHMPIWGTTIGKFLLVSRYNFTDTFMGLDVALGFLPAVPFYALAPSAYTLVVLQALLLVSAAIPVYLIARDRLGGAWAGVAFAALYLLYPTTQFMGMAAPFQPRVPGLACLLWAFWCLEQRRLGPYLLLLGLAMLARTDAALVVVAFGMYAALRRLPWAYSLVPFVVGLAYFYVAITYITPLFYSPSFQPQRVDLPFDLSRDYNDLWPCGVSPQACYYMHLGGGIPNIVKNILTHPVEVLFFVLQPAKLLYLALMLGGLLFLPLFAPRELLLAAPIFAINLLSNRVYQYVITEQYQILAIPGLTIAAIYGAAWLWELAQDRARSARVASFMAKHMWSASLPDGSFYRSENSRFDEVSSASPKLRTLGAVALVAMVALVALINVPLKNPVVSAIRYPERPARVAIMERMRAEIPPDAKVAATSFLAPHLLPRLELYYIPGGKMHHQPDEADYAFLDARAAGLQAEAAKGNDILARLLADPSWEVVDREDDLYLLRKKAP